MSNKAKHPNRVPVEGILTKLDVPSDEAPGGGRGHCVLLTMRAAVEALPTLEGMALNFVASYDGHDQRRKCGLIERAWIKGDNLHIGGFVYGHDFPELVVELSKPDSRLGMSYDAVGANIRNVHAPVWEIVEITFTGAAIMLADKAAYKTSTFSLSAAAEQFTGRLTGVVGNGSVAIDD